MNPYQPQNDDDTILPAWIGATMLGCCSTFIVIILGWHFAEPPKGRSETLVAQHPGWLLCGRIAGVYASCTFASLGVIALDFHRKNLRITWIQFLIMVHLIVASNFWLAGLVSSLALWFPKPVVPLFRLVFVNSGLMGTGILSAMFLVYVYFETRSYYRIALCTAFSIAIQIALILNIIRHPRTADITGNLVLFGFFEIIVHLMFGLSLGATAAPKPPPLPLSGLLDRWFGPGRTPALTGMKTGLWLMPLLMLPPTLCVAQFSEKVRFYISGHNGVPYFVVSAWWGSIFGFWLGFLYSVLPRGKTAKSPRYIMAGLLGAILGVLVLPRITTLYFRIPIEEGIEGLLLGIILEKRLFMHHRDPCRPPITPAYSVSVP